MKRKVFAITLSIALVLTTVFAGTGTAFGAQRIKARNVNLSGQAGSYTASYWRNEGYCDVPIYMPKKGYLQVSYGTLAGDGGSMELYNSKGRSVGYHFLDAKMGGGVYLEPLTKGGNYILRFKTTTSGTHRTQFSVTYIPHGGIPARGKNYTASSVGGSYAYYKVNVPSSGYVTVKMTDSYAFHQGWSPKLTIKLTNSAKEKISSGTKYLRSSNSYRMRFKVSRGTRYIGIKTYDGPYTIKVTFRRS